MTTFQLEISAQHENLARLEPQGGINSGIFCYFFKLRCYACNETSTEVTMHVDDEQTWYKCKVCNKVGTVKLLPNYGEPLLFPADADTPVPFVPLVRFVVTEFEPVEYCFNGDWTGTAVNGETVNLNLLNNPSVGNAGELKVSVNNPIYQFKIIHD